MNFLIRQRTLFEAAGIFALGLFLFTVGLKQQEIIGFESRFYLFALEMWRHGVGWFPTTYGVYYPDYPVTATLIIYACAKVFGGLNKFVAVFPSALAAAVTLAVTYLIGALHSRRLGWCAVFFMLMTNTFVMEARTISPDQYVGMVTALSFYFIYTAQLLQKNKRLWIVPFLFIAGFAIRGPIGLIVPAGTVCIFYLCDKNFKQFFVMGVMAFLVLCFCSAVLFGVAFHVGGMSFVQDVLRMQVSGRLQDASLPWYFYFTESLGAYAISYPAAILVALGLLQKSDSNARRFNFKLVGWAVVILVGLSIPAGKKIRYILAFTPALALLCASLFSDVQTQKYLVRLRWCLVQFFYFLPMICFIVLCVANYKAQQKGLSLEFPFYKLLWIFFVLSLANYFLRKNDLLIVGIAALTFMLSYIMVVEPVNLKLNQTRNFVRKIEDLRHQQHAALVFYQENPDGLPIKYIVNMPQEEKPVFISTPQSLEQFSTPALYITDPDYFVKLPAATSALFKIIYSGHVGHDMVLVFQPHE
jgi:4-amino-4-deoxy-L-arabinose transferase-like glycosyltransferase